jgi:hypothetical protein
MPKLNCWEIKNCGREPGGKNAQTLGVCPAAMAGEGNGTNGGKNRGRICWAIAGTFCDNIELNSLSRETKSCMDCPIHRQIKEEEGENLQLMLLDK